MKKADWPEVERVLANVMELPDSDRASRVQELCGDRAGLRAEVESLLAAHKNAGAFLDIETRLGSGPSPSVSLSGRQLGPYRLLDIVGTGGMGTVYCAERTDGRFQKQVAIKVVPAAIHSPELQRRFSSEQQILASLEHPNIARMYDAGISPEGVPYFVMEYVEGIPVTKYCEAQQLPTNERLSLFQTLCSAVQYAHQHLVVHRDLKPANILVTAEGIPKLLDFGIAKVVDPWAGNSKDQTRSLLNPLTPGYASPEQVRSAAITTATDVYSLGVVLYELLTRQAPYRVTGRPLDEAIRVICESEPEKPSAVVRRQAKNDSRSVFTTSSDLDAIVAKAMRKEPQERYASVEEFSSDIGRYLANEPVEAHPAGMWYLGRKFLRRHTAPVAAAMLVLGSLTGGLYVANHERVIAQRRFQDVRQLANKLFDIDAQVRDLSGGTRTRQLIVDTSLDYLQRLSPDAHKDPELALDVGNAYMRVARVQGVPISSTLGQVDQAEANLETADGFIDSVLKAQPRNRMAMLRAAQIAHDRMILARFRDQGDKAFELANRSEGWLQKFDAKKGDEAEATAILAVYMNVADQFRLADHFDDALRVCRRGVEVAGVLGRPLQKGNFLRVSAEVYKMRGQLDDALSTIHESETLLDPGTDWGTKAGQSTNFELALIYEGRILGEYDSVSLGRPREAVQVLERAFEHADRFVHRDLNDHRARGNLATAAITLGAILRSSDAVRALEIYDHTLRHLDEAPNDEHLQRYEVQLQAGSSYALRKLRRGNEARQRLDRALALLKQLKFYPAQKIEPGSETAEVVRALADDDAANGKMALAVKEYEKLIRQLDPKETDPAFDLEEAVYLSSTLKAAAELEQRANHVDRAAALEARKTALWRLWDERLPKNQFVHLRAGSAAH